MRHPRHSRRRRGGVLVYVAMLLFALMAVAALVLDVGLVRFTQEQMQPRADEGALEALRGNDPDALLLLDAENQPGPPQMIGYSGGISLPGTAYQASQLLTTANDPNRYQVLPNDSVSPDPGGDQLPGNAVAGPNTRHVENADYSRDDFATLTTADAALVRLRRTNEAATTTRSVRPPLPYVFARGTASNLDAWASGASVRAAAIAATRIHQVDASGMPVLDANGNPVRQEVGRANSVGKHVFAPATGTGPANFWRPGVMPFTINSDKWDDDTLLPVDTPVTVAIKAGSLTVGTAQTIIGSSGVAATSFGQPPAALTDYDLPTLAARLPTAEPPLLLSGYVPIVAVTGASSGNVIGFGFLDIDPTSVTSTSFTMTKRDGQVASSNASVALTAPLPAGTDVGDLMTQHMDPITGFKHSLLVPVLVRSMGPAR